MDFIAASLRVSRTVTSFVPPLVVKSLVPSAESDKCQTCTPTRTYFHDVCCRRVDVDAGYLEVYLPLDLARGRIDNCYRATDLRGDPYLLPVRSKLGNAGARGNQNVVEELICLRIDNVEHVGRLYD
jgi:hypothetical protein